jgi:hypothetical protein
MEVGEPRQGSHLLVDGRVVFHRATAKGVKTIVHPEVVGTQVGVVAHHGEFITLWQFSLALSAQCLWQMVGGYPRVGERITSASLV